MLFAPALARYCAFLRLVAEETLAAQAGDIVALELLDAALDALAVVVQQDRSPGPAVWLCWSSDWQEDDDEC